MSFLSKIGGFVSKVTSFASKALNFVSKPLDFLTKPLGGMFDKLLEKVPFLKFLKPLADKFLKNPLALMLPGGVGLMGILTKAASTVEMLKKVVGTVDQVVGGLKNLDPAAKNNALEMVAAQHANIL